MLDHHPGQFIQTPFLAREGFATERWQQAPDVFARHWLIYARRPPADASPSHPQEQER